MCCPLKQLLGSCAPHTQSLSTLNPRDLANYNSSSSSASKSSSSPPPLPPYMEPMMGCTIFSASFLLAVMFSAWASSLSSSHSPASRRASSTSLTLSPSLVLTLSSWMVERVEYTNFSSSCLASDFSRNILSSSAYCSASFCILEISSSERRPVPLLTVMTFLVPLPVSSPVTLRIPLASISNVRMMRGTPRGAGARSRENSPRRWFLTAWARSPSYTVQRMEGWLFCTVV